MTQPTPQQLKKALVAAGLEVYRTLGQDVVLADRVRDNLIMDSGVRLRASSPLEVRLVLRAQKADFPSEEDAHIFDRVRKLGEPAIVAGFVEVGATVAPVIDPADSGHTLDTFYEIVFARRSESIERALDGIRFALSLEKTAQNH